MKRISRNSWQDSLQNRLAPDSDGRYPRLVIAGVGNELRGDDGAGLAVIRALRDLLPELPPTCLLLETFSAPEGYVGPIRRFAPDLVLFVDVALLDGPPGKLALVAWEDTTGLSASTHTFPLHLVAHYLNHEVGCDVLLLGIRPQDLELGAALSTPVATAVQEAANALQTIIAAHTPSAVQSA